MPGYLSRRLSLTFCIACWFVRPLPVHLPCSPAESPPNLTCRILMSQSASHWPMSSQTAQPAHSALCFTLHTRLSAVGFCRCPAPSHSLRRHHVHDPRPVRDFRLYICAVCAVSSSPPSSPPTQTSVHKHIHPSRLYYSHFTLIRLIRRAVLPSYELDR